MLGYANQKSWHQKQLWRKMEATKEPRNTTTKNNNHPTGWEHDDVADT